MLFRRQRHFGISIVPGLTLAVAALCILDEQLTTLRQHAGILQSRTHPPSLIVLPPRQRGRRVDPESKDLGLVAPP